MGTVYNRGTAKKPNWWIGWTDPNGRRRHRRVGADKVLAKRVLAKVEDDIGHTINVFKLIKHSLRETPNM